MVIFNDLANAGSAPVLEQVLRFAGARQRLLAHNIANIDTPDFRPVDVSPSAFREELARAVRTRREQRGGNAGALRSVGRCLPRKRIRPAPEQRQAIGKTGSVKRPTRPNNFGSGVLWAKVTAASRQKRVQHWEGTRGLAVARHAVLNSCTAQALAITGPCTTARNCTHAHKFSLIKVSTVAA
jgi:flagellar basal body rod protein FlgB